VETFIFNVDIEVDNKIIVDVLHGRLATRSCLLEFRKIKALLSYFQFSISHIFRECNRAADYLAKLGASDRKSDFIYSETHSELKGICRQDRCGFPSVRMCKAFSPPLV
jgi:hypothetical protein